MCTLSPPFASYATHVLRPFPCFLFSSGKSMSGIGMSEGFVLVVCSFVLGGGGGRMRRSGVWLSRVLT